MTDTEELQGLRAKCAGLQARLDGLEAHLKVRDFLDDGRDEIRDRWEHALMQYMRGATDPDIAAEALGMGEFSCMEADSKHTHRFGPFEWGWSMTKCANSSFPLFSSWCLWWLRYATRHVWFRLFGFGLFVCADRGVAMSRYLRIPFVCRIKFLYPRGYVYGGVE